MLRNREAAQDGIAELMTAHEPRRRHHPSRAEQRAEPLRVPAAVRAGADDFLQRDDVGVDRAQHGGDASGTRAAIEAAAAMDVVGRDAERRARRLSHYVMIDRRGKAEGAEEVENADAERAESAASAERAGRADARRARVGRG